MPEPKIAMIGAGAMGGVIAGALLRGGADLTIIDTDAEHVAAIAASGLRVANLGDGAALPVRAMTAPEGQGWADLAVVMTPAYETANAARTAARVLTPEGAAVSMQNGLGNAETLVAELGAGRVFMGSTRVSADRPAPGCPRATRIDPSVVGELDGAARDRTRRMAETLTRGGLPTGVSDNIDGVLWSKCLHNAAINALSAITGLTMGEVTRVEGLGDLRWEALAEGVAVAQARGVALQYPEPEGYLRPHVWRKFTKPSMLQHVEQGRPVEIDAINGYLVSEGAKLGVPTPVNRLLVALARGRSLAAQRARAPVDHMAWMAAADALLNADADAWRDPAQPPMPGGGMTG